MAGSYPISPQGDPINADYEAGLQEAVKHALRINMDRSSALIKIVELIESGHTVADSLNLSRSAAVFNRYGGLDEQRSAVDWLSMLLSADVTRDSSIALANLRCEMHVNPTLANGVGYVVLSHEVDDIEVGLLHIFPDPGFDNITRQFVLSQSSSKVELGPSKFLEGLKGGGNGDCTFHNSSFSKLIQRLKS